MIDIDSAYIPELEYNDQIFKSDAVKYNGSVEDSKEYQQPHVRTWFYTNVEKDVWILEDEFPICIPYTKHLFPIPKFSKGIFIIKKYEIPSDKLYSIYGIIKYLESSELYISEGDKNEIINYLDRVMSSVTPINNVNVRLVTFIPMEEVNKRSILSFRNYRLANKIEHLYKESIRPYTKNRDGAGILIHLSICSNDDYIPLFIGGNEVRIIPEHIDFISSDTNTIGHVYCDIYDKRTGEPIGSYITDYKGENNDPLIDSISIIDRASMNIDYLEHNRKYLTEKMSEIINLRKHKLDHEVSLHKANAYNINNESNIVKLEKEEVGRYKEELKMVKDLLP